MAFQKAPNDRYGWFCHYTDLWAQCAKNGWTDRGEVVMHLALWYLLLDVSDGEAEL